MVFSKSNEDHTKKISHSVYVTNFSDATQSGDLWKVCSAYGTVIDVYIPNKRAKSGKRFAFVRFIKVSNLARLLENLCTIWIGRYHLYANQVRFERPQKHNSSLPKETSGIPVKVPNSLGPNHPARPIVNKTPLFATMLAGIPKNPSYISPDPAMVLGDECVVNRELDNCVMGEVKDFASINNLYVLLSNEGFQELKLVYLGGLWVMIELSSSKAKSGFMKHVGIASWFRQLRNAQADFVSRERIVWVDIEGVPLHVWSRATFSKIGSRWGEVIDLEESSDDSFARKRICIKTSQEDNILERFKIIARGKVFILRAKELFVWSPSFKAAKEADYCSDEDVNKDATNNIEDDGNYVNGDAESDVECVSDTVFADQEDTLGHVSPRKWQSAEKEVSSDPFNLNDLINRQGMQAKGAANSGCETSLPFPPGFTPDNVPIQNDVQVEAQGDASANSPLSCHSEGLSSRVMEDAQLINAHDSPRVEHNIKTGGSILDVLENMIKETKLDVLSDMAVKTLWGNHRFEFIISDAAGNSGGILCVWDPSFFRKEQHIISDNFVALYGTWIPKKANLLVISVYAPQPLTCKRVLWDYISTLINRWDGHCLVMGDFNEVRFPGDRMGTVFNVQGANEFNCFISNSGLTEVQLEGYSFTWSHPSAKKMSKLDRFFVTDGLLSLFPHISAVCLDRNLSDHRPILLREVVVDYGPSPYSCFFHTSWFSYEGFDQMILDTWNGILLDDSNLMVQFKKKLQTLKKEIQIWVKSYKQKQYQLLSRIFLKEWNLLKKLNDIQSAEARDRLQKAKIQWAIEGDENSKFFHGIINRKRANLAVKGVMVNGEWLDEPCRVKEEFRLHFANRFSAPSPNRCKLNFVFPNKLSPDLANDLERPITRAEVRNAVWGCGENKSPGPDGFTFEFFRKYWDILGSDFCAAIEWFFEHCMFARGCNSSFIALIPKTQDPKFVSDFRPISLIGSLYKVVTKILANRLSLVISDLISDVQTAFLPNRQILDGPFIINELLSWCKHKKQQAMVFKVDFAKAYDSVRWDFLDDVLVAFGFGSKWRLWIRGSLYSGMASVLLNGSPSLEFEFHRGLKQGDPLAPYLFILIMNLFPQSISRAVDAGIFWGINISDDLNISHLFYADDAVFIGKWNELNLSGIIQILRCFSLLSGLNINLSKSHLLGVGVPFESVNNAAAIIGCSTMRTPFKYLGVMVGDNTSKVHAWDDTISKVKSRLSNWKSKTLSVGGRLTLIKSVLGSTPIYAMSIYKVPKAVLKILESIRRNFFNGVNSGERKITWVAWSKILASKNMLF
ncbi:RNA-directed DNA polymerase, eukaryota [Tanacetum coccineum]